MLGEKEILEILKNNGAEITGTPGIFVGYEEMKSDDLNELIKNPITNALNIRGKKIMVFIDKSQPG